LITTYKLKDEIASTTEWLSISACASCLRGLEFKSKAGQILHSSPSL